MPKAAAPADPRAKLATEIAKVEAKIGKGMIHRASDDPPVYHLPFNNPHLNYATQGGVPWNRFVALYGDESTGKTLAALELVANAQALPASAERLIVPRIKYHRAHGDIIVVARLEEELEWIKDHFPDGAECLWHDIEGQLDKERAAQLGVDTDRLYISESNVIEDIGVVLPFGYVNYHLQVLDSTSAATSNLSLKQEPGKSLVGTDARQWKAVIRDSKAYFGPAKNGGIPNMVIMIHQMSTNVRTGGGQPMSTRFLRHESSCSMRFTRGKFLYLKDGVLREDKPEGADERSMAGMVEPDGLEVYAKVEKSRTSRPFLVGSMQFDYKTLRYTHIHELATSGLYYNMIVKNGTWYSYVDEDGELQKMGQGLKMVYQHLAGDQDLQDRIYARLMDHARP
jgi:RecA/RadA recombinase